MKSLLTTKKVPVTTYEEKKTVSLEMSYDEAALLYCMFGQMVPSKEVEAVRTSVETYNPHFSHLLKDLPKSLESLINSIYESLDETL